MSVCALRPYAPTDRAFICDAWLLTLRASTEESRHTDWESFRAHHNRRIDSILDAPTTRIQIAAPEADSITILGFLVDDQRAIHMLFVKKPFRRQGIAKKLLGTFDLGGSTVTAWSRDMSDWIVPRFAKEAGRNKLGKLILKDGLKYDPYIGEQQ